MKRSRHIPHIPESSLDALISAIKRAHASLLQPPESLNGDSAKVARWTRDCHTRIKPDIEWEQLYQAGDIQQRPLPPIDDNLEDGATSDVEETGPEHESLEGTESSGATARLATCLTVGLIGQPNNGKSSLLNALLGRSRVRASKTPGKVRPTLGLCHEPKLIGSHLVKDQTFPVHLLDIGCADRGLPGTCISLADKRRGPGHVWK